MMAFSSAKTILYPTPLESSPIISPIISLYTIQQLTLYHLLALAASTSSLPPDQRPTLCLKGFQQERYHCSVDSRYGPVSEMSTSSHAASPSFNGDDELPSNLTTHLIETSGPSQPQGSRRRTGHMLSLIPPSTSAIYSSLLRVGNKSVWISDGQYQEGETRMPSFCEMSLPKSRSGSTSLWWLATWLCNMTLRMLHCLGLSSASY